MTNDEWKLKNAMNRGNVPGTTVPSSDGRLMWGWDDFGFAAPHPY